MEAVTAATVALVVCKMVIGAGDANTPYTGWHDMSLDLSTGQAQCRRVRVELDQKCTGKLGAMAAMNWDMENQGSRYRVWRSSCSTPVVNLQTGEIIAWHLPSCTEAHRGEVLCDNDQAI